MHIRNQKIFEHIAKGRQKAMYWGNDVSPWLCPEGKADLLVYGNQDAAYLICNNEEKDEQLGILVELFSYLHYAEENHLIYVKKTAFKLPLKYNFYDNHAEFNDSSHPEDYDLGGGIGLYDGAHEKYIYDKSEREKKYVSGYVDVSFLYAEIKKYLFGEIHPACGLKKFIKHDYLCDQDYHSNQSLLFTKISVGVAVFVAALSPILTICIGNKYGETTLKEWQYRGLTDSVLHMDTVERIVHDTVVEYRTEIKYRKVTRPDTILKRDTVCPDLDTVNNKTIK